MFFAVCFCGFAFFDKFAGSAELFRDFPHNGNFNAAYPRQFRRAGDPELVILSRRRFNRLAGMT
jgi:hypothetical protein